MLGEYGMVRVVMPGREHLFDVQPMRHGAIQGAAVDGFQRIGTGGQDDDRLHAKAVIAVRLGVLIWLADDLGRGAHDPAHQEGGDVQLLPGREVVADDDGDLGASALW